MNDPQCRGEFKTLPNIYDGTLYGNALREKCPKYGVFSGLYFPLFGLNTNIFSPNTGIYGPEKTPYLDNVHVVIFS